MMTPLIVRHANNERQWWAHTGRRSRSWMSNVSCVGLIDTLRFQLLAFTCCTLSFELNDTLLSFQLCLSLTVAKHKSSQGWVWEEAGSDTNVTCRRLCMYLCVFMTAGLSLHVEESFRLPSRGPRQKPRQVFLHDHTLVLQPVSRPWWHLDYHRNIHGQKNERRE